MSKLSGGVGGNMFADPVRQNAKIDENKTKTITTWDG
jgi:hypothetical protein